MELTVDREAQAAYLRLTDHPVARTVQVSPDVLVDLDSGGEAVGVELLST